MEYVLAMLSVSVAFLLPAMAFRAQRKAEEEARRKAEEDARLSAELKLKEAVASRAAAEESRRKAKEKLDEITPDILRLYEEMSQITAFEGGYLMKKVWDAFLESAAPTLKILSGIPNSLVKANPHASKIQLLMEQCMKPIYRTKRNNEYKDYELKLCNALFSDIDGGKSLDKQQRDAIVTDEYSNLVIAGAGSGKTSVVVGKVKYLVERWGIDPAEILVTSFTRASVDDLKTRIEASGVHGVSAKTFHALGLNVLGSDFAVANENELERHVTSYLSNKLTSDPFQAAAFLEFFGLRCLSPNESPDSKEAELRMKLLKAQDMLTLKGLVEESRYQSGMDTLRGERVKSLEELMIANFLFLNGVEYEYEGGYPYPIPEELSEEGHRAYQPDFHLVSYDIWLEHFGIDENGRVPWIKDAVEEQRYIDNMKWKRQVHAACGTKLIESYSFWNKDQDLLNQVESLLKKNGVVLVNDPERNAAICGDLLRDQRFFSSMTQLITTFISLVKSGNKTEAEVDDKARMTYRGYGAMWHRYDLFTRFTWPILRSYQLSLEMGGKPKVDFDDMINRASERIRKDGYKERYRYIIVDEYQDISLSRLGLLSAIRDATGAKLMCVGDDWQAIYRFAGSDVTLFTNFEKLIGFHEKKRIGRTYRNSQALVDAASKFVLKNPDQLRKTVRSMAPAQSKPPIAVISLLNQQAAFTFALNDLLSSPDGGGEIKVLGRNRRDLERIFPGLVPTGDFSFREPKRRLEKEAKFDKVIVYRPAGAVPREIGYMTVHKSKGLQADNVIVIGLVNDRYGFPNMMVDDPILELLLADSDNYEFAEERRLFYVALTRTKNRVWLVTGDDSGHPGISRFVDELYKDNADNGSVVFYSEKRSEEAASCPRCGGVLLKRNGPTGEFVGCSNYPFCDKTYRDPQILIDKKKCPQCGGWLTRRRGYRTGEFFGCTNYPTYCQFTMNLDDTIGYSEGNSRHTELSGTIPVTRVSIGYEQSRVTEAGERSRDVRVIQNTTSVRTNIEHSSAGYTVRHPKRSEVQPKCPKCGAPMIVKSGPYGRFYGCTDFPRCRGKRKYVSSGTANQQASSQRQPANHRVPNCPKCGAQMVLKRGKFGSFYSCSRYPFCEGTRDILK